MLRLLHDIHEQKFGFKVNNAYFEHYFKQRLTMKRLFLIALMLLGITAEAQDRQQRLKDHVYILAADSLKGRAAGSEYSRRAASYIKKQYEEIGVKPFFEDWFLLFAPGGVNSSFNARYVDVVGVIEGSDPKLKNEYIVLGAHYDHLGTRNGKVYNGADDNASGSAALIEVARELYSRRDSLRRSVIIAAFDAEELGLWGSKALSDTLVKAVGLDKIKLMMSLDMVGWYKASGKLKLEGTATIKDGQRILAEEADKYSIVADPVRFEKSIFTATDTEGFASKGIPTLAVTTGLKSPYHKPEDDAELIDYEGLDKVAGYISDVTLTMASDPSFEKSGLVARKHALNAPAFEFGLVASIDRASMNFHKSALITKEGYGGSAGVQMQVNSGCFGLNVRGLYEYGSAKFPDDTDPYSSFVRVRHQAVTVPAMIMIQSRGGFRGFLGFGGYFSRIMESNIEDFTLSGKALEINKNQYGLNYSIGFVIGQMTFDISGRNQVNNLFNGGDLKARFQTFSVTLGYIF